MSDVPEGTTESREPVAAQISTRAVQLLADYTGRGPTKAHTVINHDSVTIVLRNQLTKGERKLVETGCGAEVLQTRKTIQSVMKKELTAIVEQKVGRQVLAFLSDNHVDPDVAIEFFLLEPLPQNGASASADAG